MPTPNLPMLRPARAAWNKGRIVGQERPLLPMHVWVIRVRLELAHRVRDLALFTMAVDSNLRGCDLVRLKVADVVIAGRVKERASIIQGKTQRPVQIEIRARFSSGKLSDDRLPAPVARSIPTIGRTSRRAGPRLRTEFGLIYVNGDNNLENLKAADDTWKVRLIEEDFHRLMFDAEGL